MGSKLEQLRNITDVVADTGDINAIKQYQPLDATTNPSLLLKAAELPVYENQLKAAKNLAKTKDVGFACDALAVAIGSDILEIVSGKVSTEVDARLSFDKRATIERARRLIAMYQERGIGAERILIKIASTWEGIQAAKILEQEGIECNLTLLFDFSQAQACANANVTLISPFVGRIFDWYKQQNPNVSYTAENDPGVASVTEIFHYYKNNNVQTIVMGASFRNVGQILALSGCDRLTISPDLLAELDQDQGKLETALVAGAVSSPEYAILSESDFRLAMNNSPMATEKLSEGIRKFAEDQVKLEQLLLS